MQTRTIRNAGAPALRRRVLGLCLCAIAAVGCTEGEVDLDLFDDAGAVPDGSAGDGGAAGGGAFDAGGSGDDDAGSEPDAAPGPNEPTPDEWPALLSDAFCDALETCYGGDDLLRDALNGQDCAARYANVWRAGELRYLPDAVAQDRVLWQPAELDACLSAVRALRCDVRAARLPAACERLLTGTVALGDECALHAECEGPAFCDRDAACPGTCTALRAAGETCTNNDDEQCEDGLVCFEGTCEPLGRESDACDTGLPACMPGLVCRGVSGSRECIAIDAIYFGDLGDECMRGGDLCLPGLVCESMSDVDGVCAETVGEGEPCKRASPSQCPPTQYCSAEDPGETGQCTDFPGDGEPCLDASRSQRCADGAVCLSSVCRARVQVGAECTDSAQCWSGACGEDGRCAAPEMCAL